MFRRWLLSDILGPISFHATTNCKEEWRYKAMLFFATTIFFHIMEWRSGAGHIWVNYQSNINHLPPYHPCQPWRGLIVSYSTCFVNCIAWHCHLEIFRHETTLLLSKSHVFLCSDILPIPHEIPCKRRDFVKDRWWEDISCCPVIKLPIEYPFEHL